MSTTGAATQLGMESDQNALNMLMTLLPFFVKPATYPGNGGVLPDEYLPGGAKSKVTSEPDCETQCAGLPTTAFFACMYDCAGKQPSEMTRDVGDLWKQASKILIWVVAIILILVALALLVR